jgi:trk system potassium uptake protein
MKVIVVGCGRLGSTLAFQLYQQGHQVTVIDQDEKAFDNLPKGFRGRTVTGDVLTQHILRQAEIEKTDALAAVTSSDSLNALITHVASTDYQVSRVVARNYNPNQRELQEAFGVPVVGSSVWGAKRIGELLTDSPLRPISINGHIDLSIYQLDVPNNWQGHALAEFISPDQNKILTWIRDGQSIQFAPDTLLQQGDTLYIHIDQSEYRTLSERLGLQPEQSK